jgi:outer membrane protein TolC
VPAASATPAPDPAAPAQSALSLLDAVRTTLRKHPALAAASAESRARRAELGLSEAPFDPLLTSSFGHRRDVEPLLPGSLHEDTTSLGLGLSKRFAIGTTVLPSVGLSRLHQRTRPPTPGVSGDPRQRASVELTVTQPLLRGAGTTGAASEIRAAERSLRAAEQLEGFTAQALVLESIQRYFLLAAADQQIVLLRASRDRARTLVDETRVLVEADQRPRGDLRQLEGNLATREHALLRAETARAQALLDLNLSMGLDQDAPDVLPSDGYPTTPAPLAAPRALTERAVQARRDVKAAEETLRATSARLEGQDHNTLPDLELSVSVG